MSNPADAVNAREKQALEGYIARELARFETGRRATARELQVGDMFVVPMRAQHEPQMVTSVRTYASGIRPERDAVVYGTSTRIRKQWLEAHQPVVIL